MKNCEIINYRSRKVHCENSYVIVYDGAIRQRTRRRGPSNPIARFTFDSSLKRRNAQRSACNNVWHAADLNHKTQMFSNYFLCTQNAETHFELTKRWTKSFAQKAARARGNFLSNFYSVAFIFLKRKFQLERRKNCCKSRVPTINLN